MSHPTWVRGLKLFFHNLMWRDLVSHPTWVRGLKPSVNSIANSAPYVAPYVGAWIETCTAAQSFMDSSRTLRGCVD